MMRPVQKFGQYSEPNCQLHVGIAKSGSHYYLQLCDYSDQAGSLKKILDQ